MYIGDPKLIGKHEKHLLIGIVLFFLVGAMWVMIASFVTWRSPIILISNFIFILPKDLPKIIIFFLIGLYGFYCEMTIISNVLQFIENDDDNYMLDLVMGFFIGFIFLGFVFGIDEVGILEGMYNMLLASLGFSIILVLMFLGAVIARVRKNYFK